MITSLRNRLEQSGVERHRALSFARMVVGGVWGVASALVLLQVAIVVA